MKIAQKGGTRINEKSEAKMPFRVFQIFKNVTMATTLNCCYCGAL